MFPDTIKLLEGAVTLPAYVPIATEPCMSSLFVDISVPMPTFPVVYFAVVPDNVKVMFDKLL